MSAQFLGLYIGSYWTAAWRLLVLLSLLLLLTHCDGGGQSGSLSTQSAGNTALEQQAIEALIELYQAAFVKEDIDRVVELLDPDAIPTVAARALGTLQRDSGADLAAFFQDLPEIFRRVTVTALTILETDITLAPDHRSVTFLEVESLVDPTTLAHITRVFRTTWILSRTVTANDIVTYLIRGGQREGPVVQINTPGQVQPGALTRIEVAGTDSLLPLAAVEIEDSMTGVVQALQGSARGFYGAFRASGSSQPPPLQVRLQSANGEHHLVPHAYRVRGGNDGVVQPLEGTGGRRFFAVDLASDGTAWFGGEIVNSEPAETLGVGHLVQVAADGQTILQNIQPTLPQRPDAPVMSARLADIVIDELHRLHAIFLTQNVTGGIVANGDIVLDLMNQPESFCQTVNAFNAAGVSDPAYPFQVRDPQTGTMRASPSTRAIVAGGGDIWLFGSDGGVAQVTDDFRMGRCPETGVTVTYAPVLRRGESGLLANTVPALVVGTDGALWFGTALGVTRFQAQQFTPVPFDPVLSLRGDVTTLEMFFQAIAEAIFEARPLTTVAIGDVSFVEAFGNPVVKEDLMFDAVEDSQGRIWFGTLGGGIRRLEVVAGVPQDTLHLTRQDGLVSNIILALTVGPDGSIWAATDEGISHIRETSGEVTITNFTALDGLILPVRDIAVGRDGTAWLATDGGGFRITPQGGQLQGTVRDANGRPVREADVLVLGTPYRAVTDADGHFTLTRLPPGPQRLQVDGALAVGGPFGVTLHDIVVQVGEQPSVTTMLEEIAPDQLLPIAGDGQTAVVGSSLLLTVALSDLEAGIPVTFTIRTGNGSLASTRVPTDATGRATTTLTLGTIAGPNQVEVSAAGRIPVVLTVTGEADQTTAQLRIVGGNNQVAAPGEVLPEPLVVQIEDQFGNGLPGVPVTAVVSGNGEILSSDQDDSRSAVVMTDAAGAASFRLRIAADATEGDVVEVLTAALGQEQAFEIIVGFVTPTGITVAADGALITVDSSLAIVLRVDATTGSRTLVSGRGRGSGPAFMAPEAIVEFNGAFMVVDRELEAVIRIDPVTGDRTIVSDAAIGSGPPLAMPKDIAIDQVANALLVVGGGDDFIGGTASEATLIRVEPLTGNRTLVSGDNRGNGPSFGFPVDITVASNGFLVVDPARRAVLQVDPVTGDRTLVSGCTDILPVLQFPIPDCADSVVGNGTSFRFPSGLAIASDGSLIVVDGDRADPLQAVVRVDPSSGDRTLVSGPEQGSGPPFQFPSDVAIEASGTLVVVDGGFDAILRVAPASGDRTIVSRSNVGSGPPFRTAQGIAVEADGNLVVTDIVSDSDRDSVVRVDPSSGDRTLVSGPERGSGPLFGGPFFIAVETDGSLVVVDTGFAAVVRVDPLTGDRTIVSDATTGSGLPLFFPFGLAVEPSGTLVILDGALAAVVRIDPLTGDRSIVSDATTGSGPIAFPAAITVGADGVIAVLDVGLGAVVQIDPLTGDRTIVSDATTGSGPILFGAAAIAAESTGTLVVLDAALRAVVRVDPVTGDRTVVADATVGSGPLFNPLALTVEADGSLLVLDIDLDAVVRIDAVTGNRRIVSR